MSAERLEQGNMLPSSSWLCLVVMLVMCPLHANEVEFVEPAEMSVEVSDHELVLENTDDHCLIKIHSADNMLELPLRLKPPCYWVTQHESTALLQYSYPDKGVKNVLLVAGGHLDWDEEKRRYFKLPPDIYCSANIQGVLLKERGVVAVDQPIDIAHCQGMSLDEVNFQAQADSTEYYAAETSGISTAVEAPKEDESLLDSLTGVIKRLFD